MLEKPTDLIGNGGATPGPVGVILAPRAGSRCSRSVNASSVVAGRTLLERAEATLGAAGVADTVVVGEGCRVAGGESMPPFFGRAVTGRRFLLLRLDHIFEPEAVRRLLRSPAPFALGVDSCRMSSDRSETTSTVHHKPAARTSAPLSDGNAADAGIAICSGNVAEAAARAIAGGQTTWGALKARLLADGHTIEGVDLADMFWLRLETLADLPYAERELVRLAARQPFDGPVFRYVNRRISWRFSLILLRLGIQPAVATGGAFALALIAAVVLALGGIWTAALVAGGLLVELASILDAVNGELARASLRSSAPGAFFDSVLDHIADPILLVALAVATGFQTATWVALTAAIFGCLLGAYVNKTYEACGRRPPPPLLRLSFGRDARLLAIAAFAVALQPFWALIAVAVLANVEATQRFVAAARSWREPSPSSST